MREDFEPQRGDIICIELLGLKGEIPSLYLVLKVLKNDDLVTGYWDWRKYPDKRRITLVARLTDK